MKTKTIPLASLLIEVIQLRANAIIRAEVEQTIDALQSFAKGLDVNTPRKRRAA